jgi:hypothetical protein
MTASLATRLDTATGAARLSRMPTRAATAVPTPANSPGKSGSLPKFSPPKRSMTARRYHSEPADAVDVAVVAALGLVACAALAWVHPCLVAYAGVVVLAGLWRAVRG